MHEKRYIYTKLHVSCMENCDGYVAEREEKRKKIKKIKTARA